MEPSPTGRSAEVLTIGHSTRPIEEFVALLEAHGVTRLVDVRSLPRSRRNPQFNQDQLPDTLARAGIAHTSMPELGGLRTPRPDSTNLAWRNESFRGYADHMQTPAFDAALDRLLDLARRDRVAIMCAEALPWRCHRSLIADALVARGHGVSHILSRSNAQPHALAPFARVEDGHVSYPAPNLFESSGGESAPGLVRDDVAAPPSPRRATPGL
jgi:uncharacterized protein (DUF488 family)